MTSCQKCDAEPVIHLDYNGASLCAEHFTAFVEKRVQREIRRQGRLAPDSKLAIAVSGGKDSMSMLYMLAEIFAEHRDMELIALSVDEGLQGYRNRGIGLAADLSRKLGIPHHVLSFEEAFGITLDTVVAGDRKFSPCMVCGVLRRKLLNTAARDMGATRLVVGHNLDDMSQSILMNIVNGDVQRLVRLGPHARTQEGLVPRMLPLRTIPEEEMKLYAEITGLPHLGCQCPNRPRAHRLSFLKIIRQLEKAHPGTRHSILSSYDQMIDALRAHYPPAELNRCSRCGEPTSGEVCKACRILEGLGVGRTEYPIH